MKGMVFNLLEEVVTRHHGEDAWDALLDQTGLSGAYTSLGNYPDADMQQLVQAAADRFQLTPPSVLRWFGQQATPVMAQRYPHFFQPHSSTRPFLLNLNSIIHPEVRKIYAGADVPVFDFEDGENDALLMGYQSARGLCTLAQGFAEGAAQHYRQKLDFRHLACMHNGDDKCLFHITFHSDLEV